MEDMTLLEAQRHVAYVETCLLAQQVEPYSIAKASAESLTCLEGSNGNCIADGIHVVTDVSTPAQEATGKKIYLRGLAQWDDSKFLLLRAGLLDRLPASWGERIAYWQWADPVTWQKERLAWRTGKRALVDAVAQDKNEKKLEKYANLKRKYKAIEEAMADERPAKRPRQLSDEEILAERKNQQIYWQPPSAQDEDEI